MNKKILSIIGMGVSACLVVLGVLTLVGAVDGGVPVDTMDLVFNSNSSGFAKFGTDFYTYVNNNAAQAALYTIRIYALLRTVSGLLFIGFGLLSLCYFATKTIKIPEVQTLGKNTQNMTDKQGDSLITIQQGNET